MVLWVDKNDPKIKAALRELKNEVRRTYPDARFSVYEGEEPLGVYLVAILDVDEPDALYDDDRFIDLLLDIQVERRLRVYVETRGTREREVAEIEKYLSRRK